MILAPVGAFLTGIALGWIRGFEPVRPTWKSSLTFLPVLAAPALYLMATGADEEVLVFLTFWLAVTYLCFLAGALLGSWTGRKTGHGPS